MTSRKRNPEDNGNESASSNLNTKRFKTRAVLSTKLESIKTIHSKSSNLPTAFCPHCESRLSMKTYKKHKMLYYNEPIESWTKAGSNYSASTLEGMPTGIVSIFKKLKCFREPAVVRGLGEEK